MCAHLQDAENDKEAAYRNVKSNMKIPFGAGLRDSRRFDEFQLPPPKKVEQGGHTKSHGHHHRKVGSGDVVAGRCDSDKSDDDQREEIVLPSGACPGENQEGHDRKHQHDQSDDCVRHNTNFIFCFTYFHLN